MNKGEYYLFENIHELIERYAYYKASARGTRIKFQPYKNTLGFLGEYQIKPLSKKDKMYRYNILYFKAKAYNKYLSINHFDPKELRAFYRQLNTDINICIETINRQYQSAIDFNNEYQVILKRNVKSLQRVELACEFIQIFSPYSPLLIGLRISKPVVVKIIESAYEGKSAYICFSGVLKEGAKQVLIESISLTLGKLVKIFKPASAKNISRLKSINKAIQKIGDKPVGVFDKLTKTILESHQRKLIQKIQKNEQMIKQFVDKGFNSIVFYYNNENKIKKIYNEL